MAIKDASTAGKVGFELLSGNAPPLLLLRSSDIGRCKARAADMWTITNTFQPQDVGQGAAPKRWRRYEDDRNYPGRKELRAALPELGDLFMRRVNFSATSALAQWPGLKGQQEFLDEEWARSRKDGKLCDRICKRTRARWELDLVTMISFWFGIHHSDIRNM